MPVSFSNPPAGLIGFGAFGQLMARHLAPHVPLVIADPGLSADAALPPDCRQGSLAEAAACGLVLLAVPVSAMAAVCAAAAPHVRPGAVVADVGSVKVEPARIMTALLPEHADLVGTHPLFGPQSAAGGLQGRKIAVCGLRGRAHLKLAVFLKQLGLKVILTTPEAHDREAATVQGLTHLIARTLAGMEPLPRRMTTASFDLLAEAVGMVRHDPPGVFAAITEANPFAADVRNDFLMKAAELAAGLGPPETQA